MPRADQFPEFDIELTEDPYKGQGNALRVKGGGEAGITPSSAALINAVIDALSGMGIEHIDMPVTPQRLWMRFAPPRGGESAAGRRDATRLRDLGYISYVANREFRSLSPPVFGCGRPDCSR